MTISRLQAVSVLVTTITVLSLGTASPARASPPPELGCETYGCLYSHDPTYYNRQGDNERPLGIAYERLPDGGPDGRRFERVLFPEQYDPSRRHLWDQLAYCESTWRWSYRGVHHGGAQFNPQTWTAYGGGEFAQYAYNATPEQQIAVAERVLRYGYGPHRAQGPGAWPHCSRGVFR